jgi:diguanylate cyclase (GGDEF)-like protein/PAS domain S-box-containing protein
MTDQRLTHRPAPGRARRAYAAYSLPLVIVLLGSAVAWFVGGLDSATREREERAAVNLQLSAVRIQVESQIRASFGVTEGIAQLLSVDGAISPERFEGMAREVMHSVPYLQQIVVAPGDVLRDVYPWAGNSAAIGLDMRQHDHLYPMVKRARVLGRPVLAGPIPLISGGEGLVYRRPVFVAGSAGPRYWGNVSVIANIDDFLLASGIATNQGLQIALRGRDGTGAEGAPIWGDAALFASDASLAPVDVPGGSWQLAAQPVGGWSVFSRADSALARLCALATVLLGLCAAQLTRSHALIHRRNTELRAEMDDRQAVQASLVQSEQRFRDLFERSPDGVWIIDRHGANIQANTAAVRTFGFVDAEEFRRHSVADLSPPWQPDGERSPRKAARLRELLVEQGMQRFEWLHQRQDGSTFPAEVTLCRMELGNETVTYAVVRDISERKQAEVELLEQKALLQAIVDNAPSLIYMFDTEARLLLCNHLYERSVSHPSDLIVGHRRSRFMSQPDAGLQELDDQAVLVSGATQRFEDIHHSHGQARIYLTTKCPLRDPNGRLLGVLGISNDITEIRQTQADLERLAHYDAVTGLVNRVQFQQRLAQGIERVGRNGGCMAVLILDIDGFKLINDTLGHPMGDLLLQQATARFLEATLASDTVARLGGDEFAFILNGLFNALDAVPVVQTLLQALNSPFDLNGNHALVTASIGVAICPADGASAEVLMRHADTALYGAKEAGRNGFRFYERQMTESIQQRVSMESALRRALREGEFELWFQPKLDLASGRVEGAEALLRWRDPVHGLVMPNDFIPLAERTGLIIAMGAWVLDSACAQVRQWRDRGVFDGRMAINVAAPQIDRSDFVESVRAALQRHGLPAHVLEVEVTESLLMASQEQAREVLGRLQEMGVTTAVDDFGTGYSSLAYLKLLPIDNLKIDRAFVRDLPGDSTYVAITRAIIDLGRALNFQVTAEGIETVEQYEFLRTAGCDSGQGYWIGRPMPAAQFETWLGERKAPPAPARLAISRS